MSHKYDAMKKLLHDACMLKAIEDLEAMPTEEEIAKMHEFSPEFLRNMEKMMEEVFGKKRNKEELAAVRKRNIAAVKKFSAVAALIISFSFSCAMAVEDIRDAFVKYIIDIYDDYLRITETSEVTGNDRMILDYYEPTWLPEGYVEVEKKQTLYSNRISYTFENNNVIFRQILSTNQSVKLIDYDPATSDILEVPDFGNYITTEETNYLIWSDDEYSYAIIGNLHLEDMLQMADSLVTD